MTIVDSAQPTAETKPTRDLLRALSLILVIVGLAISGYLSYVKLTEVPIVCVANSEVFNCEVVQNSAYSRIAGIPVAWFGFAVYVVLFGLLLLENRIEFLRQNGILVMFGITIFAWLYSMYLVYLQFFVLKALCPWCLGHEATMTLIFIVACLRLRKTLSP
ncbi:MAG: vitamin K epoxide reductase family protein [Chloroflexota bacterium]